MFFFFTVTYPLCLCLQYIPNGCFTVTSIPVLTFRSSLCFVVRRGGPLADDDGLDAVLSGGGARGGGRGGKYNLDPAVLLIVYCMVVDC